MNYLFLFLPALASLLAQQPVPNISITGVAAPAGQVFFCFPPGSQVGYQCVLDPSVVVDLSTPGYAVFTAAPVVACDMSDPLSPKGPPVAYKLLPGSASFPAAAVGVVQSYTCDTTGCVLTLAGGPCVY